MEAAGRNASPQSNDQAVPTLAASAYLRACQCLPLGEKVGHQGIRVPMSHFVPRLEQAHEFHVLEFTGLSQNLHPMRNRFAVGLLNRWEVLGWAFDLRGF